MPREHAVVVVGGTGSGKSTLVQALTGDRKAKISGSGSSLTKEVSMFKGNFIDTPGFADSDGLSDEEIRGMILAECCARDIGDIKVILCMHPGVRADSQLQQYLEFIAKLGDKGGAIHASLLVMVFPTTQKTFDRQRARVEAAYNRVLAGRGQPAVAISADQVWMCEVEVDEERGRVEANSAAELADGVRRRLGALPSTQVVFQNYRCRKCMGPSDAPKEGRMFEARKCHKSFVKAHEPGKEPDAIHPQAWGQYHPGHVRETSTVFWASCPRFSCCEAWHTCNGPHDGCTHGWLCCRRTNRGAPGCTRRLRCPCKQAAPRQLRCANPYCKRLKGAEGCSDEAEHDLVKA